MTGGVPAPVPVTENVSVRHSVAKVALRPAASEVSCPVVMCRADVVNVLGPVITKVEKSSRREQTFGLISQIVAKQVPVATVVDESKKVLFSLIVPPQVMVNMQQTPKLFAQVPVAVPFLFEHSDAV